MSKKRKSAVGNVTSTPPSKKRKLIENDEKNETDNKKNTKKFSDPTDRNNDCGLMVQNNSHIDYTKYQAQKVVVLNVAGCVHKICYPPPPATHNGNFADAENEYNENKINLDFDSLNSETIIKYPYTLDIFQKRSICAIENNDNVLVAAHTSAGKTTVAEYAIAKALSLNQRVIYTSPIKALSNQKYRQLQERFIDVGLMTGDTTLHRDASCIVMTTEILRNMLFRGAEIIREISWVIFDEIHYMKDPNRGVVWEETLILLPQQSRFVFLSATIPNSVEFAKWISKINGHCCHVIYTEMRPVPLQHYVFPSGGSGIYLCVDHKSNFKESNFQRALNSIQENNDKSKKKRNDRKGQHNKDIFKLIKMIMEREFDPCIVFAFSKKGVEDLALSLSKLDFCNESEKKLVARIFNNAISTLGDDDRMLPQIQSLIHLLTRGIGIHHSGLLPILKEIVEILFGEGLIRVLFTTETFSMGVNFPAKTVIFSSLKKYDGECSRLLTSGEYIQMSGRAGRRGLDERGIVIMMVNEKMEPKELQVILKGKSQRLLSQFHINYSMLIQLRRLEDVVPTYIIHRSFMQFQKLEKIPALALKLDKIRAEIAANYVFESAAQELEIEKYFLYKNAISELYISQIAITNKPLHILPWLNSGRLLYIAQPLINNDIGWCACINYKKISKKDLQLLQNVHQNKKLSINYIVDVLTTENKIISVQLHHILKLSGIRLNLEAFKNLRNEENKNKLTMILNECLKRHESGDNLQELHPIKHLNINDKELIDIYEKIQILSEKIKNLKKVNHINDDLCIKYKEKKDLEVEIVTISNEMTSLQNNQHIQLRLNGMNRVLRRLKMVDMEKNTVITKGKIACEISTGDELVLTELLFSNLFNEESSLASCEYINALLSCFIFDEGTNDKDGGKKSNDELNDAHYKKLKEKILIICEIQKDSKLEVNSKKYLESFGKGLMDVVLAWSKGASFNEITKMTKVYEGSVIRVLKRLDELLSELVTCSQLIGNRKLTQTFVECKEAIKRDIVFSSSLYL